ncbi:hypothetical protein AMATHDRAFT_71187 [Amanita thiersii Skay4041]|uniref:Uncharacterized protein n=1 Tax=Amanita thiersii Skay4041 TaxID=703135 RepID=A0A2A9N726_9AGAR|nr:hypothetical protein AMATHDRAFT_71187 [Amanita thiersii Skay4041]
MTGRRSGLNTPVDERYLSRSDLELVEHTEDTRVYASRESLHPPSISHGRSRSPATTATPSPSKHSPSFVHPDTPETPRHRHHHHHHHRSTSDSSSIFPALPSNMTMLMHEDNNMLMVDQGSNSGGSLGDLHHHHHQHGLAPSALPASDSQQQQQSLTSSTSSSTSQQQAIPRNITHRKGQNIVTATSANRNSTVRMSMTSSASISPTTANFSVVTGSPASLFLRPEHEVHLGDMDTFSLDFGRIEEGDQGDDW